MILYDGLMNPNSLKIRAVAHEVDMPIEVVIIDMKAGGHKASDYLAKNPNGKVPTLTDGDFSVWESNAIMCYIAMKSKRLDLLPAETKARTEVEQWLFWQTAHLATAVNKIAFERFYKKLFELGDPDPKVLDQSQAEVQRFSAVLDQVLNARDYVTGSLTVADFSLAATYVMRGEDGQPLPAPSPWLDVSSFKNLQAWLKRMQERPSWQQSV